MSEQIDVDGSKIRLHREGSGERIIIYLHSGSGEVCSTEFFRLLAGAGSTVLVPEFPGFGGTKPLPLRLRRIEDAIFYLRQLVDALAPGKPVTLIGASFGGWLAAEFATWFPDRIENLVLIGAAGLRIENAPIFNMFGVPGLQEDLPAELGRRANPHGVDLAEIVRPALADTGIPVEDARLLHGLRAGTVIAQLGWNPYLHDPRLQGRLRCVSARTLVIWGEDDGIVPRAHGETYAKEIPDAKLVVIGKAGHAPMLEKPQATADEIIRFFGSGE